MIGYLLNEGWRRPGQAASHPSEDEHWYTSFYGIVGDNLPGWQGC